MALDLTPNAFKRRVSVAMDRATPGTKRMLGYAAMSDGIGERYEIRLLRNGVIRATFTMTGKLPYSLSTGLAPTATLIASVTQVAAIDVTDGGCDEGACTGETCDLAAGSKAALGTACMKVP